MSPGKAWASAVQRLQRAARMEPLSPRLPPSPQLDAFVSFLSGKMNRFPHMTDLVGQGRNINKLINSTHICVQSPALGAGGGEVEATAVCPGPLQGCRRLCPPQPWWGSTCPCYRLPRKHGPSQSVGNCPVPGPALSGPRVEPLCQQPQNTRAALCSCPDSYSSV